MGTSTPWVGDAFFARTRTPEQIEAIQAERFDTDVEAAMRAAEGTTQRVKEREARIAEREHAHAAANALVKEWMRITKERYENATRVQVDEEAFGLLPARQCNTILAVKDPAELTANYRAARRFFRRIDGRDLHHEADGYTQWLHAQYAQTPEYLRWKTAPVDPLTPEEAATVGVSHAERAALQQRHEKATRLYVKGEIRPAGMTLERAIAVAHAAQDAIDNGTAPTYQ